MQAKALLLIPSEINSFHDTILDCLRYSQNIDAGCNRCIECVNNCSKSEAL